MGDNITQLSELLNAHSMCHCCIKSLNLLKPFVSEKIQAKVEYLLASLFVRRIFASTVAASKILTPAKSTNKVGFVLVAK